MDGGERLHWHRPVGGPCLGSWKAHSHRSQVLWSLMLIVGQSIRLAGQFALKQPGMADGHRCARRQCDRPRCYPALAASAAAVPLTVVVHSAARLLGSTIRRRRPQWRVGARAHAWRLPLVSIIYNYYTLMAHAVKHDWVRLSNFRDCDARILSVHYPSHAFAE